MQNNDELDNEQYTSLKDQRLEICRQCPFFNSLMTACKMCGCNLYVKTVPHDAECPIGKW